MDNFGLRRTWWFGISKQERGQNVDYEDGYNMILYYYLLNVLYMLNFWYLLFLL
jgi:hypothetical protein